jgi:hypothetical protein
VQLDIFDFWVKRYLLSSLVEFWWVNERMASSQDEDTTMISFLSRERLIEVVLEFVVGWEDIS